MPIYTFTVSDSASSAARSVEAVFETSEAARQDALGICSDFARDAFARFGTDSEWCLDVADESGAPVYTVKLVAKSAA